VNKYAYTPFGEIANQQEAVAQPFKFVGQYGVMAEPNGLYYMRARYYDPIIGRFISEDPSGFGGGDVNLYAYVGNNPVLLIDPLGLCKFQAAFSAVGPNQALGIGALGIQPPNGSLAINPAAFGLPYGTIAERIATQGEIKANIGNIRISAPGLSEYYNGPTTFTIGDVGDKNIRNSPAIRFDIYRFPTQKAALEFGKRSVDVTITGLPDNWTCPN
jgi:RHS repeat-associated protein